MCRLLFSAMHEAFCIVEILLDAEGKPADLLILEANPSFTRHTGVENPVGRRASELFPTLEPRWMELYHRVATTGVPEQADDFSPSLGRHFTARALPVSQDPLRIAVLFSDITAERLDHARLLDTQLRYRTLFDSINQGFCLAEVLFDDAGVGVDYRFLEVNPAFEAHSGLRHAVGHTARELIPGLEDHWPRTYGQVAQTRQPQSFVNYSPAMGRWFEVEAFPVGEPADQRVAILFTDITARKTAQEALRESEERFRVLVEGTAVAVWEAAPDGTIVVDSPSWRAFTGLPPEKWLGEGWVHGLPPEDREEALGLWKSLIAKGEPIAAECRLRVASGGYRWTAVHAAPLRDLSGRLLKWVGMNMDIHEQKRTEERLRRREKELEDLTATLEHRVATATRTVRHLASNLALAEHKERTAVARILHDDLQQMLVSVQMRVHLLQQQISLPEEPARELLDDLAETIRMTRTLTVDLSPPVLRREGFPQVLAWLGSRLKDQYSFRLRIEAAPDFPSLGDEIQILLYQIVRELLFNVVKHAGVLDATVSLRVEDDIVHITISDQGRGFNTAALTTAASKSGFGLASVRERLELFDGRLHLDSQPGKGCRVHLTLPVLTAGAAA